MSRPGPVGCPVIGVLREATGNPLGFMAKSALKFGDLIPYQMLGRKVVQVNHPDHVRRVLIDNHKNYGKSKGYIRFESVLGQGLPTSNGEKWKRDRQKLQPMFRRDQVEGYHFEVINEISEKFKQRWLKLTEHGPATINITDEMASITLEAIVKIIFGKDNLDDETVQSLYRSYSLFTHYLKKSRVLPNVDLRKVFRTPAYRRFAHEIDKVEKMFERLKLGYESHALTDQYNMLALLINAQKKNPELFDERDIRDQTFSMVFAGFETTAVLMQWMWVALDMQPEKQKILADEIKSCAPCTVENNSMGLSIAELARMDYLTAVFKETMRLYPPFWVTGREALADDYFGDFLVKKGTVVIVPQMVMQRHPLFWEYPNAFMPERFMGEKEKEIDDGAYFPFSHGPRKCIGYKVSEIEAKVIFAKLFPMFRVKILNALENGFDAGVSLQPKHKFMAQISRA